MAVSLDGGFRMDRFTLHSRMAAIVLALSLAGCLAVEEPLPPKEALARAAQRIERLLAEEGASDRVPPTPGPAQRPADPRPVSFWFYTHPLMGKLLGQPALLKQFNASQATTRLTVQYIGDWHIAIQKLTVNLAVGDVPDVAIVKRAWLARLIASGRIAELDRLLPSWLVEDFRPGVREGLSRHGHLYALPADGFCSVLFYNRERMTGAPPRNWEDLRRIARELGPPETDDRGAAYPIGDVPFLEALWSAGGYVCDDRTCGLDAPEAHEALNFVLGLRKERFAHPRALGDPDHAFDLFLMETAAMTVASSSHLGRARKAGFPVGVAPAPGKSAPVSRWSDDVIVVFRRYADAKHAAITETLAFLTGPQLQGGEALARGSVPARSSVAEGLHVAPGLDQAALHARSTPLVSAWGGVAFELARHLELAYRFDPQVGKAEL